MFFSILASIIVWGLVLIIALRVFANCGIALPQNKLTAFLYENKCRNITEETTGREILYIFLACLIFRILIYIISTVPVALFTSSEHLDFASWLNQWKQWDANGYNNMILGGYKEMTGDNGEYLTLVFFPLYSFIGRILNFAINNTQISAIITSSLCYAGACCFLYKLVILDYGKSAAKKAVLYISIFPFGFFFGAMMTESTFFLTTAATLYCIRQHNWIMAGICGIFASLSRISGIAVIFPAVIEFIEYYNLFGMFREKKIKEAFSLILKKGLWIFLSLLGILIFLYCNYSLTGNWFEFLELDKTIWNQQSCYFGKCIITIWNEIISPSRSVMVKAGVFIPDLLSIFLVLASAVYGTKRSRSMYMTYLIVYFVMNTSITWPMSIPRYMLCAIPMFIFLADFSERHEKAHLWITVIFAVMFGIYMTGYLFSKQIM